MNPAYDFHGRVAVVTGAGSGKQGSGAIGASFVLGVALPIDGGYTAR
jgi:hypothetical protein